MWFLRAYQEKLLHDEMLLTFLTGAAGNEFTGGKTQSTELRSLNQPATLAHQLTPKEAPLK